MNLLAAIRQILGFTGDADAPPSNQLEFQAAYDPNRTRAVPLAALAYGLIDPVTGEVVPVGGGGATPAGSGTELQFRDGDALGAVAGSSWDGSFLNLPDAAIPLLVVSGHMYMSEGWVECSDNKFAIRYGDNPQSLEVYNSYIDFSNYSRLYIGFPGDGNVYVACQAAGSGASTGMVLQALGEMQFTAGGTPRWKITTGGDLVALSTYSISGALSKNIPEVQQTLTDGATVNWDMNSGGYGILTLGGNRTVANPTNTRNGATYVLELIQDGTGSRTVTWGTDFVWSGGLVPALTTTAGKRDILTFVCSGGKLYGTAVTNF